MNARPIASRRDGGRFFAVTALRGVPEVKNQSRVQVGGFLMRQMAEVA